MAFLTLEDDEGSYEVVVFPRSYTEGHHHLLDDYSALIIGGTLDMKGRRT